MRGPIYLTASVLTVTVAVAMLLLLFFVLAALLFHARLLFRLGDGARQGGSQGGWSPALNVTRYDNYNGTFVKGGF